jgi:hypothetical protein
VKVSLNEIITEPPLGVKWVYAKKKKKKTGKSFFPLAGW